MSTKTVTLNIHKEKKTTTKYTHMSIATNGNTIEEISYKQILFTPYE